MVKKWGDRNGGGGSGSSTVPADRWYHIQVVETKVEESRAGKRYIVVWLKIVEGDYAGRMIRDAFHVQGKDGARNRIWNVCNRLGLELDDDEEISLSVDGQRLVDNPQWLEGLEGWVQTQHREYNGRTYVEPTFFGYERLQDGPPEEKKRRPPQAKSESASIEGRDVDKDIDWDDQF